MSRESIPDRGTHHNKSTTLLSGDTSKRVHAGEDPACCMHERRDRELIALRRRATELTKVDISKTIIISYNVQEYEVKTLSKVVTFQKYNVLFIIKTTNTGMKPSILCYVPPSVELLGPTTPSFDILTHDTPCFQTRLAPLFALAIVILRLTILERDNYQSCLWLPVVTSALA